MGSGWWESDAMDKSVTLKCKILILGTMWIVGKQWITSVDRTKCMIKLVLIHFKLRLSFLG